MDPEDDAVTSEEITEETLFSDGLPDLGVSEDRDVLLLSLERLAVNEYRWIYDETGGTGGWIYDETDGPKVSRNVFILTFSATGVEFRFTSEVLAEGPDSRCTVTGVSTLTE